MSATGPVVQIRILIFRVADARFGVDMVQIAEMLDLAEAGRRRTPLGWFNRFFRPDKEIPYRSPVALALRRSGESPAIVVDQPEAIDVPVAIEAIHPMPPLFRAACAESPVWGAVLEKTGRIILLVDFFKLI